MNYRYEVSIFTRRDPCDKFEYESIYRGQSLFKAVLYMILFRRRNIGCIKLEWRG